VVTRKGVGVKVQPGAIEFAHARCEPGEVAVGGGGLNGNTPGVRLLQTSPEQFETAEKPTEWVVSYENATGEAHFIFAEVVCASP
jgi:hypothetical protein